MNVRTLESREDVAGLIRTHGLAWRKAYDGFLPEAVLEEQSVDPDEAEIDRWDDDLRANSEGVLVAVDDAGAVRGFIDLRWGDAETADFVAQKEAQLKAIYVDPAYWNEGIGTALLEEGLERPPESVTAVRLEVFAENDVGRQFYEARGFERTDTGEYEIAGRRYPTRIYTRHL